MTSNTRLQMSAVMIVISAMYAVLIAKDPEVASAVAVGYIALLLTVFILANVRKKP